MVLVLVSTITLVISGIRWTPGWFTWVYSPVGVGSTGLS